MIPQIIKTTSEDYNGLDQPTTQQVLAACP